MHCFISRKFRFGRFPIEAAAVTEWQFAETYGYLTVLTARHWYSKESLAATYWTLIGPFGVNPILNPVLA